MQLSLNQIYVFQTFTQLEYVPSRDNADFQWDGNSFQRVAFVECARLNSFQFATKFDVYQVIARTECPIHNDPGGWQADALQRSAVLECSLPNYFQLATFHIRQGVTFHECTILDNFDARHDYSPQGRAFTECHSLNLFDIFVTDYFNDVWMLPK